MTVDALLQRRAKAHGSAKLGRRRSMIVESRLQFVHQGLTGTSTTWREAPQRWAEDVNFNGTIETYGGVPRLLPAAQMASVAERLASAWDDVTSGRVRAAAATDRRIIA